MAEAIVLALFCFFASYGFIMLTRSLLQALWSNRALKTDGVRLVLLVKNREKDIEGIVRSFLSDDFKTRLMLNRNLKIVDLNSQDNTFVILEKMKKDFENLDIVKINDNEHEQSCPILRSSNI